MRFCKECDNLLYPKEKSKDEMGAGRLIFECRICGNSEKAKEHDEADNCVYRSDYGKMTSGFSVDVECIKDPTLSRKPVVCRKCANTEAVTFINPTKDRMNLVFVCTKCQFHWKKEELDENDFLSEGESD
mmetsp:Transcript_20734/g.15248  ORF Transcript_20734/g.15248 Transcript_20734/m.15248 type:complete len:130 (-) Transcript_20734:19-408(-)